VHNGTTSEQPCHVNVLSELPDWAKFRRLGKNPKLTKKGLNFDAVCPTFTTLY
jgi:hypothetical protein